jgi:hypothetical protein
MMDVQTMILRQARFASTLYQSHLIAASTVRLLLRWQVKCARRCAAINLNSGQP